MRVDAYNPATNAWVSKAAMPDYMHRSNGAAVINGTIYVPGGLNNQFNPTDALWAYNTSTNSWQSSRCHAGCRRLRRLGRDHREAVRL